MEEKVEKKKSGYGLFIFLFILFFLFVWFLPDLNDFLKGDFSSLGFLQKKDSDKKDTNNTTKEVLLTCNMTKTENDLTGSTVLKFYSINNKLQKVDGKLIMTANTEESKTGLQLLETMADAMGTKMNTYSGMTFSSTINESTYTVNIVTDYSKVDKSEWASTEDDGSTLNFSSDYDYNEDMTTIKSDLVEQGYTCK